VDGASALAAAAARRPEAEHTRELAIALWALSVGTACAHVFFGWVVWLHARGALSPSSSNAVQVLLACSCARYPLLLLLALALGGMGLDGAVGMPRRVAVPLCTLRLASAAGAAACAVLLVAQAPVGALYCAGVLLSCLELQALAWAAMLIAPERSGGVLALLPRYWLSLACETDALTLLQLSSECMNTYLSLWQLWWGSIFIHLSREEIDESLAAGALPRSLYRLLHRPLLSLLPSLLLSALTADPTEHARAAIAQVVRRSVLPASLWAPAASAAPPVPTAAAPPLANGRASSRQRFA
jgi:hypothetical protein